MGMIMPEIVVQRILQKGIKELRDDSTAFNDIFSQFLCDELSTDYGQTTIDQIRQWFFTTKIPVLQAWSLNPDRIPCFSIHLASEAEDENKAAIGDHYGDGLDSTVSTGVFTVHVDVGIHGDKSGNTVLWLYYIMAYIFFKQKKTAERLGLQLHTWQASDYNKNDQYLAENIWSRWVRFRCTTQNWLNDEPFVEVEDLETCVQYESIGDDGGDLS